MRPDACGLKLLMDEARRPLVHAAFMKMLLPNGCTLNDTGAPLIILLHEAFMPALSSLTNASGLNNSALS
jgi:hypothetical protein